MSKHMSAELFEAIEGQDVKRAGALLAQGNDPNTILPESPHWRPLDAALEEVTWYGGPMEVVRLLLQFGADPNAWVGRSRVAPLHLAMRSENKEAIRLLLEAGANPNVESEEGESAMRWAVEQGDLEMAKLFLLFGARETINDFGPPCGDTPLTMAAKKLDVEMIELLLNGGADLEALDEDNRAARERLPRREDSDPQAWDRAIELLEHRKT